MFDWIPINIYATVYFNIIFTCVFVTLFHSYRNIDFSSETRNVSKVMGYLLLTFVGVYMGTRPISYVFADMATYARVYNNIQAGQPRIIEKEFIFNYFMVFCTKIMNDRSFFFVCATIYILPCYFFAKKYGGTYWYFVFLIFVASYMFWPFGTNGIRNGLGTSVFLLALCFYDRKIIMYILMALSFGIHSSILIPITAFLTSGIYKKPKVYLYVWLAAIPLSLLGGGFWESLFGGLGFGDDSRAEDYLTKGNVHNDSFSSTGFRWDFVFYSSFAVFAGWYFIFKQNIKDQFYIHLWGTYMIANAFWILVIRANFSNRFAYLSWFLMAPIIAYPLLRYKLFPNQYRITGLVIFCYYFFTYFMFIKG